MGIKRNEFCGALLGGTALLILQACGGGGGDSAPAPAPAPGNQCGSSGAAISGNHGHVLTINRADLDSTTPKTYSIMGSAGHDHSVTFDVAQLGQLKAGMSVTVTSTLTGHQHNVTATCV